MNLLALIVKKPISLQDPMMYFVGDELWMVTATERTTGNLDAAFLRDLLGANVCDKGITPECKATILLRAIKQVEQLPYTLYHERDESTRVIAGVYRDNLGIPVLLSYGGRSAIMVLDHDYGPHPDYAEVVAGYKEEKGLR